MLTIAPAIICFIASLALHENEPASNYEEVKHETQFFNLFNIIAVTVAFYLLTYDITGRRRRRLLSLLFASGLLILLAMPVLVPLCPFVYKSNLLVSDDAEQQISEQQPLLLAENKEEKQDNGSVSSESVEEIKRQQPMIGEEHTILEMLKTLDFWVLFMSFLCGVGTGLCVMNNMGQIGLASGYNNVSIFISFHEHLGILWTHYFWLCLRVLYQKVRHAKAILECSFSNINGGRCFVGMTMAFPGSLYIGSMIVGICYGVRLTITTASASELFGLRYYGLLYNILILNLPLGSFLFSSLIAGNLYDAEAARQKNEGEGNTCIGSQCYMLVYVIMAFVCVIGYGLDLVLAIRTKKIYSKMHQEKTS